MNKLGRFIWVSNSKCDAMILAAGRGKRMGYLTDLEPKPLMRINDLTLIEHQIVRLRQSGITNIMINVGYRSDQIMHLLGDGTQYGVCLFYSVESPDCLLETAGGVRQVLDDMADEFWVVNADIWCDYRYAKIELPEHIVAQLLVVNNPEHHLDGDFKIEECLYTFSGMGYYRKVFFEKIKRGEVKPLVELIRPELASLRVSLQLFEGYWQDVGTEARLKALQQYVQTQNSIS